MHTKFILFYKKTIKSEPINLYYEMLDNSKRNEVNILIDKMVHIACEDAKNRKSGKYFICDVGANLGCNFFVRGNRYNYYWKVDVRSLKEGWKMIKKGEKRFWVYENPKQTYLKLVKS